MTTRMRVCAFKNVFALDPKREQGYISKRRRIKKKKNKTKQNLKIYVFVKGT